MAAVLVLALCVEAQELTENRFDALRSLLKPRAEYGEPQYLDELPWFLDLAEARKKAAAEGKALLLFWGLYPPLGVLEAKGFECRGPFFCSSENFDLIALGELWCLDVSGLRYSPGPGRVTVGRLFDSR